VLTLGGIVALEQQLKAAIVALNKRGDSGVTIVEAIVEAALWPEPFGSLAPLTPNMSIEQLGSRAPGFICAVASEIGFRFEGVGTIFWVHFEQALGLAISQTQRYVVARAFEALANTYNWRGRARAPSASTSGSSPGQSLTRCSRAIWSDQ
jgi:hypothetical protein